MVSKITKMSKREFHQLPDLPEDYKQIIFDSLIILPTKRLHDSGWRCMYLIPVVDGKPLGKLGGITDVIDILPDESPFGYRKAISIDCVPEAGLLRVFPWKGKFVMRRWSLSDMQITFHTNEADASQSGDEEMIIEQNNEVRRRAIRSGDGILIVLEFKSAATGRWETVEKKYINKEEFEAIKKLLEGR